MTANEVVLLATHAEETAPGGPMISSRMAFSSLLWLINGQGRDVGEVSSRQRVASSRAARIDCDRRGAGGGLRPFSVEESWVSLQADQASACADCETAPS